LEKIVTSGSTTKIVVLDGYVMNPGDLSWDALKELGPTQIYDRTPEELAIERARDAEAVLTSKTLLSGATLRSLKKLRYIGVLGTGYNNVDVNAAKELGITVANVPTYGTASVAQFTFALLLELCCHVGLHSDIVRAGAWSQSPDWSFWRTPLTELAGKTLGVVGFGRIGREVARIAAAMQMRVISTSRSAVNVSGNSEIERMALEDLLAASDVISLHCPLTPENKGMIDVRRLSLIKPSAFLINTSRGPLIVDQDLADALNAGRLAGAALDVLSVEPPPAANPLFTARNCIITPHIAWATLEARSRLVKTAIDSLAAFLRGTPQNVIP
jgi:glycerate dehydrogenase